jgi:thiol-disulfide isomerase/thioredoxin
MKTRTLGIVIVVAVVAVAAVLAFAVRDSSSSAGDGSSPAAGAYAGEVISTDEFKVATYAGKPLVVNLFGSWCPPCNAEAPDLAAFAEQNPDAQVVGIACEDTQDAAEGFMAEYGLTYPLVVDDGSQVQEFAITAFPTTIFYDAQGKEVDRLVGAATLDQFNASLAKAQ